MTNHTSIIERKKERRKKNEDGKSKQEIKKKETKKLTKEDKEEKFERDWTERNTVEPPPADTSRKQTPVWGPGHFFKKTLYRQPPINGHLP